MTRFGTVAARVLVCVLSVVAVGAQIVQVDSVSLRGLSLGESISRDLTPTFLTLISADAVVSGVAAVLAITLAFRRVPTRGGPSLAVALASWSYLLAYAGVVRLLRPESEGLARLLFDGHFPVVETLGLAGIVHFTGAFPTGLKASDLDDPETLPVGFRTLQALRIRLLEPAAPWVTGAIVVAVVLGLTRALGRPLQDAPMGHAMDAVRFAAVGIVVLNLRRAWVVGEAAEKARMLWIGVGLGLFLGSIGMIIGGQVLLAVTGWPGPAVAWRWILMDVGLSGLLWSLAMSVIYAGSMDSVVALKSVVALASSVTLGLLLATGLEALLSNAPVAGFSFPDGFGTVLAFAVVLSVNRPVRTLVARMLDQVLDGVATEPAPG